MTTTAGQRVDRALLIGIDRYLFIQPNLGGCIGDVQRMRGFLVDKLHTPAHQIVTLTSSLDESDAPEAIATRANIIAQLMRLGDVAGNDERIYIHYSGHGMRNDVTLLPGIEPDGRDEAISPMDSGYKDPAAHYLLDKELGWLIRRITDRGALVTVVMDCCHSASSTRGLVKKRMGLRRSEDGVGTRGWEGGDPRPRPDATLVAPLAELRKVVLAAREQPDSLAPARRPYVVLTACREQETAKEYQANGVLTHFLLKHLEAGSPGLTYRTLLDCAAAEILDLASHDRQYDEQHPQLEGPGDLIIFGDGTAVDPRAIITALQADGTLLLTGGGAAVGMTVGTTVGLYPPGAKLDDPTLEVGVATVTKVTADAAIARVESALEGKVVNGMKAIVIRPGSARVRRRVGLGEGAALDSVRQAIMAASADGKGSPYLEVVAAGAQSELEVIVKDDVYVILDEDDLPLPRITPQLTVGTPDAAKKLVQRLEHVVQYRNAWELTNRDGSSRLRDLVAISVARNTGRGAGTAALQVGEMVNLHVHNRSKRALSVALLYFGPDWKIERIWPEGVDYTELGPTADEGLLAVPDIEATLPEGLDLATERLKLIATDKPTSFPALLLDTLDNARATQRGGAAGNPLEQVLASIGEGRNTRELVRRAGTGDWATAEMVLVTTRAT